MHINIRLFNPGAVVKMLDGRVYTVKYNRVKRDKLFVYFYEIEGEWDSEMIDSEPTIIPLNKE